MMLTQAHIVLKYTSLSNRNVHVFIYVKYTSVTHTHTYTQLSLFPHESLYQRAGDVAMVIKCQPLRQEALSLVPGIT